MSDDKLVRMVSGNRLHMDSVLYRRERGYHVNGDLAKRLLRMTTDADLPVFRETDEDELDLEDMVVIDLRQHKSTEPKEEEDDRTPEGKAADLQEEKIERAAKKKAAENKKGGRRIGRKKAGGDDVVEI